MKCKVCGAESGKYPLCKECNKKKELGEIIKCPKCQKWHYTNVVCSDEKKVAEDVGEGQKFLYQLRFSLVTKTEMEYLNCIKSALPENCLVQAQANLASFIVRTDNARFQTELYRNVDFLVTDLSYRPLLVIEINDQTHLASDRRERDKKVSNICEEAGIPIIKLWTSYGINQEYIKKRIAETLTSLPVKRIHHFMKENEPVEPVKAMPSAQIATTRIKQKNGCYIATCVYGSYDCPQVWTLRRFRDNILRRNWAGRIFIKIYYAVSPILVKIWGEKRQVKMLWKKGLDCLISYLRSRGLPDTPYTDCEK